MKKILFRIPNMGGGGAEKVLIDILKNINQSKYKIDVLINKKGGIYDKEIPSYVETKYLWSNPKAYSKKGAFFQRKLMQNKLKFLLNYPQFSYMDDYDIEIAFLQDSIPTIAKSRNKKSKKIAWIHNDLYVHKGLKEKKKKEICQCLHKFDAIFVVSQSAADALVKLIVKFSIPNVKALEDKIKVVYNPVDINNIIEKSKEKNEITQQDGLSLISVGRFNQAKRFDRLIKTHKNLIDNGYIHTLYLLGEGELDDELTDLINELGVNESVKKLGFKPNPYSYMKACDIFVASSDYEGFSLVVCEAMVLGKPIVSTKVSGPTELLKNGECGILTELNEAALYEGITQMLNSKETRDYFSNQSIKRSQDFNVNKIVEEIETHFDELLNTQ